MVPLVSFSKATVRTLACAREQVKHLVEALYSTLSGFYDESFDDHSLHNSDNRLIVSTVNCISLFVARA